MLLFCFRIVELLFWSPAVRGCLVAEWRLMLNEGGARGGAGGRGGEDPTGPLISEVTCSSHEVKTNTRQRRTTINRWDPLMLWKRRWGCRTGNQFVCEGSVRRGRQVSPPGNIWCGWESSRGHEPSYYLDLSSKLTWMSAVVTCEKAEKDGERARRVAAAELLTRLSVMLTNGLIFISLKRLVCKYVSFLPGDVTFLNLSERRYSHDPCRLWSFFPFSFFLPRLCKTSRPLKHVRRLLLFVRWCCFTYKLQQFQEEARCLVQTEQVVVAQLDPPSAAEEKKNKRNNQNPTVVCCVVVCLLSEYIPSVLITGDWPFPGWRKWVAGESSQQSVVLF